MLDLGWSELFLIGVVALVVIGPKDLPQAMRALAKLLGRARGLSREFQNGMSDMMREAEIDELRRKMERARNFDLAGRAKEMIDPTGTLSEHFDPAEFEFGRKPASHHANKTPAANAQPGAADLPPVAPAAAVPPPTSADTRTADSPTAPPLQSPPPASG